jgi:hypothetical protein
MTASVAFSSQLGSVWIAAPLCATLGYPSKWINATASHRP